MALCKSAKRYEINMEHEIKEFLKSETNKDNGKD